MENAADALKMAAFVLMFIGALTIAMLTLSKAKTASEAVVYTKDETNYYTYAQDQKIASYTDNNGNRKVKLEAIIPTLYRYYIENYRVEFEGITLYTNSKGQAVNYLDLSSEQYTSDFLGSQQKAKEKIDEIIQKVLIDQNGKKTFVEQLAVTYEDNPDIPDINKTEKRTIKYTKVD